MTKGMIIIIRIFCNMQIEILSKCMFLIKIISFILFCTIVRGQDDLFFDCSTTELDHLPVDIAAFQTRSAISTPYETVVFTKSDYADWTLPENQDQISANIWITRKHNQSIFNIAQEDGYSGTAGSPMGTLWANTTTAAADSGSYTNFVGMHGGSSQSIINDTISLYLPQDSLYFDVVFTSYTGQNNGGGFSYIRTSVNNSELDMNDEYLIPDKYALQQNFPNPFNPRTTIHYELPKQELVQIIIFDLLGHQVKRLVDDFQGAGVNSIVWDTTNDHGQSVSAGIYIYQLQVGRILQTRKMIFLK